ncbi:hypothetical protein LVD15_06905 [Fulvivirga maritima]|uniref:hypothetical protein n=1 Tax=Fulvivirga maritima TaxID=2904247 RepID=UPI001F291117|nr:hypothetical protein [Fulvivirga maritima]UII28146.1 hypothetical protein LVD15_06905 [Fulvivirga maritima]
MSRGIILLGLIIMAASCGGNLSNEERKALHNEMNERAIKKISEESIFEKALDDGRTILSSLNSDSVALTEVVSACKCTVKRVNNVGEPDLNETQKSIWDAYKYVAAHPSQLGDNVQKDGEDLLYSAPIVEGDSLLGVWFISFSRKEIILSL